MKEATHATPFLCVVDQTLKDQVGHFYEYAHCLYVVATERGHRFLCLAHRDAEASRLGGLPVQPVFRYTFFEQFERRSRIAPWLDPFRNNLLFYRDLKRALRGLTGPECVLFMPTLSHNELMAWGWWLMQQKTHTAPSLVLLIRGNYYYELDTGRWNRAAMWARAGFRLLERAARGRTVRIATDSDRLAEIYRSLTRLPVEVFPIPHTRGESGGHASAPDEEGPRPRRLVLLGSARSEKGFVTLVEALRLLAPDLQAGAMEVVLQCNVNGDEPVQRAREQLESWHLPNVTLVKNALSAEEYYQLLDNSDIVLIPYRLGDYQARTSGVLAEAFAAGKAVVTTEGTWMAAQVAQGGGGVLCRDGDAADLARAMREAVHRYPELRAEVLRRQPAWVAFHNPHTLYDLLMR
ncbi:MAG: glycosyltransferase, partial [Armatimonadota bacterium]|nr:glycosyltransferase [Armatimonadota bacterium]